MTYVTKLQRPPVSDFEYMYTSFSDKTNLYAYKKKN